MDLMQSPLSPQEIEAAVDDLYSWAKQIQAEQREPPSTVELVKKLRANYPLGIVTSKAVVAQMEVKYEQELKAMGYFPAMRPFPLQRKDPSSEQQNPVYFFNVYRRGSSGGFAGRNILPNSGGGGFLGGTLEQVIDNILSDLGKYPCEAVVLTSQPDKREVHMNYTPLTHKQLEYLRDTLSSRRPTTQFTLNQ